MNFIFPQADIPISIISIDKNKSPVEHFEIARKLRELSNGGDIVHNLRLVDGKIKLKELKIINF